MAVGDRIHAAPADPTSCRCDQSLPEDKCLNPGCCLFHGQEEVETGTSVGNVVGDESMAHFTRLLGAGLTGFDLLGIGLITCNSECQLLGANQTANEILESRDGLAVNPQGVLCATDTGCDLFSALAQRTAEYGFAGNAESHQVLAVGRHSAKRPLTVLVHFVRTRSVLEDQPPSVALVLIFDSSLPREATEADLKELYGFTAGETHLANLLMEGRSLNDSCRELGIHLSTGRSHLRRLFKKTGLHHQSQLVSLLLKGIGLARLRDRNTKLDADMALDLLTKHFSLVPHRGMASGTPRT